MQASDVQVFRGMAACGDETVALRQRLPARPLQGNPAGSGRPGSRHPVPATCETSIAGQDVETLSLFMPVLRGRKERGPRSRFTIGERR